MTDGTPPAGDSQAPVTPPSKGRSALLWWGRLANYVIIGAAAVMILVAIIEGEGWRGVRIPLFLISMAIVSLSVMHMRERKRAEQEAAADGGREVGPS